jgi:hypothetical protein
MSTNHLVLELHALLRLYPSVCWCLSKCNLTVSASLKSWFTWPDILISLTVSERQMGLQKDDWLASYTYVDWFSKEPMEKRLSVNKIKQSKAWNCSSRLLWHSITHRCGGTHNNKHEGEQDRLESHGYLYSWAQPSYCVVYQLDEESAWQTDVCVCVCVCMCGHSSHQLW